MYCKICGYKTTDNQFAEVCPQCGYASGKLHGEFKQPGDMIGKYRVLRLIGRGGSGDVYLCDHPLLMTRCAVKVLNRETSSRDKVFVERFLREAKIAAALHRPDVVAVLDAGINESTGEPFIVMEYVDGESLESILRDGPLPEKAVLGIAVRVATVLAAAEELGIVHRDIKPGNILFTSTGDIKLADLGIAKSGVVTSDTISGEDVLLGTPEYSSPEQLRSSHTVDIRADIYSLGATMYHMLTGSRPFKSDTVFNTIAKVLETSAPPVSSYRISVSSGTAALVSRMMEKNPENRFQNISDLMNALRRCMESKRFFFERLKEFFVQRSNSIKQMRFHRKQVKKAAFITPRKLLRDVFLCFSVLLCLLFAWFNFGRSFSEKIRRENLLRYEEMRKKNVRHLLEKGDYPALYEFLSSPETGSRSRREIFLALLRRKHQHDTLLRLISEDVFFAGANEDFLGAACAVANCSNSIVQELIRSGAEIDFRDKHGRTPLMKALLAGNFEAVNTLLEYGADACLIDNEGRNVLSYLPAHFTAELLDSLLECDVPVNVADRRGRTPLMIYVDRYDSPKMVQLMIDRKFNKNRKAHNGETALMTAVRRRHMASAETLFLNNAKYDVQTVSKVSKEYRLRNWMENKIKRGK